MRILPPSKRKGISPVLATVILIAITLIAAIAIAGFVFGLFGTFTSTARVQASVTNCSHDGTTGEDCQVILTNSGNANTATTGACSMSFGGSTYSGHVADTVAHAIAGTNGVQPANAGSSPAYFCDVPNNQATSGQQVTGSVILANGGNALFSAVAS